MKLYLVQHAEAVSKEADPQRPLSEAGVRDAEDVARFIKPLAIDIEAIWHSDKPRSQQTAQIFAAAVAPRCGLVQCDELLPESPIRPVARELRRTDADVMIVGHLPFLAELAGKLLTGKRKNDVVAVQKAGVLCLERDVDGVWKLLWCAAPALVRAVALHAPVEAPAVPEAPPAAPVESPPAQAEPPLVI